jgi:hypothetical protein
MLMAYVMPIAPVMRPIMLLNASEPPRLSSARHMQMKWDAISIRRRESAKVVIVGGEHSTDGCIDW